MPVLSKRADLMFGQHNPLPEEIGHSLLIVIYT
jgi:hypothetical protein